MIFPVWKFCEQNCAWFVSKIVILCFHCKRKTKKSWLPSSILIRYAFQHNFLELLIPANTVSHVQTFLAKINMKVESREQTRQLCTTPVHFIRSCFQHCWLANFWIFCDFSLKCQYYDKQWLLLWNVMMGRDGKSMHIDFNQNRIFVIFQIKRQKFAVVSDPSSVLWSGKSILN